MSLVCTFSSHPWSFKSLKVATQKPLAFFSCLLNLTGGCVISKLMTEPLSKITKELLLLLSATRLVVVCAPSCSVSL